MKLTRAQAKLMTRLQDNPYVVCEQRNVAQALIDLGMARLCNIDPNPVRGVPLMATIKGRSWRS